MSEQADQDPPVAAEDLRPPPADLSWLKMDAVRNARPAPEPVGDQEEAEPAPDE